LGILGPEDTDLGMGKVNPVDILDSLIQLMLSLAKGGPVTWSIFGVVAIIGMIIIWRAKAFLAAEVQKITDKKRNEALAKAPVDNQIVEKDTKKSEDEIEEIIKNG